MADKQAHLNGAYYGPAVPPANHYHRPGRGSGCGCGCCLLTLLLKIIVTIVALVGLAALIVWLIFRPINKIKFHANDISLTQFNLTTNQNLDYKLALNITIRNPNKKIGVYYDRIEARAYFDDRRLKSMFLTPFYQGHKNTTVLTTVFEGQQLLLADEIQEFNEDKTSGIYSIDVKLYLRIRFKLGRVKTPRFRPRIKCELKVPLSSSNGGSVESTKCDVDY
ncbi:hypothetical protein ACOSP7_028816 [Xanthoceras sorbifolium]|uniref:Late embryogenesis abundant protein LEA-2 subgroup domain-containing protein n=1 Tax=Xanthoceras sorbifolium TaxID=99658 RepID=A0ABQ8HCE8_9ROSI|nr:hypothetical protein JRO89_XS12G0122000 [Xanthoceras sorbifolium]